MPIKKSVRKTNGIPFKAADALLLCSIMIGGSWGRIDGKNGKGIVLKDILGAWDSINKNIVSLAELRNGFSRLTKAGYVLERNNRFSVIGEAAKLFKKRGSLLLMCERFLKIPLKETKYVPNYDPYKEDSSWPYPSLTKAFYKTSVERYKQEFDEIYRNLVKKKR